MTSNAAEEGWESVENIRTRSLIQEDHDMRKGSNIPFLRDIVVLWSVRGEDEDWLLYDDDMPTCEPRPAEARDP